MKTMRACGVGLGFLGLCATTSSAVRAEPAALEGRRWASTESVSATNPKKVGSRFFLDVVVSGDGTFRGSWDTYVCFAYAGPYGTSIYSCPRSKHPRAASGRFDVAARQGRIALDGLGETSFGFDVTSNRQGQPQLEIELPRDWLKEGDVLHETSLNPR